jgi:GNAT superfamily N-acetyltransferase
VSIAVRRATRKDAALIAMLLADVQALHAAGLPGYFKPVDKVSYVKHVAAFLKNRQSLVFLAYIDDNPAGYIHAETMHQPETVALYAQDMIYIRAISVRPTYRRQGVGSALMASVRAAGRSLRIERLGLNVWTFNDASRQFFRHQGLVACCEYYVTASDLGRDRRGR